MLSWTGSPIIPCIRVPTRANRTRGDTIGALVDREVRRLKIVGGKPVEEEVLFSELDARVRDIRNGPEGALYILLLDRIVRVVAEP